MFGKFLQFESVVRASNFKPFSYHLPPQFDNSAYTLVYTEFKCKVFIHNNGN